VATNGQLERLCVVLVGTRNPLNIGAAARAMSNFGVSELRLVNPYDPSFREARSAVGAAPLLKKALQFSTLAEAVRDCSLTVGTTAATNREPQQPLRSLDDGAKSIRRRLRSDRVALLFGSEKRGLSNEDLSHCHWLIRIQSRPQHPSMNLGQAVAVCLYALSRDGRTKPEVQRAPTATSDAEERLMQTLLQCLKSCGYVKPAAGRLAERKLRSLVRRLSLQDKDAQTLLGMVRQILWKLQH
jgi:tRNA/rRNA methyltransferase